MSIATSLEKPKTFSLFGHVLVLAPHRSDLVLLDVDQAASLTYDQNMLMLSGTCLYSTGQYIVFGHLLNNFTNAFSNI